MKDDEYPMVKGNLAAAADVKVSKVAKPSASIPYTIETSYL